MSLNEDDMGMKIVLKIECRQQFDFGKICKKLVFNTLLLTSNDDSLDWKDYGVESIVNTVNNHKNLGNGSIILCHNGAKYTAEALEGLITGLLDQGYEIVPISQLIYKDNYHMDHTGRQISDSKQYIVYISDEGMGILMPLFILSQMDFLPGAIA